MAKEKWVTPEAGMRRKPETPEGSLAVIGTMSGTSLDAVDAAFLETDGERVFRRGRFVALAYPKAFRERLREGLTRAAEAGGKTKTAFFRSLEKELTRWHARAILRCLKANHLEAGDVDFIGFHGQTLFHNPKKGVTWQLGDGRRLAERVGINVIADFRSNDMRHGGEGAPLAPLYHHALFGKIAQKAPVALLNIGGVANITWLWKNSILAFDCGPGNALLDDWVFSKTGRPYDREGKLAAKGHPDSRLLKEWLRHPYFKRKPPKSLDRNAFSAAEIVRLNPADGAATLAAFTIEAVAKARQHFPRRPNRWIVTGGGRRNSFLMQKLRERLKAEVAPIEAFGFNGDALEAEAFGFLAVRALQKLPLSLPETTGVKKPVTGGKFFRVRSR